VIGRITAITASVIALIGNTILRQNDEALVVQWMVAIDRNLQIGFRRPLLVDASNPVVRGELSRAHQLMLLRLHLLRLHLRENTSYAF
jgi:hypothetical protein